MTLPNTPEPKPLVLCHYCKRSANPDGAISFGLRVMCRECLQKRGIK